MLRAQMDLAYKIGDVERAHKLQVRWYVLILSSFTSAVSSVLSPFRSWWCVCTGARILYVVLDVAL